MRPLFFKFLILVFVVVESLLGGLIVLLLEFVLITFLLRLGFFLERRQKDGHGVLLGLGSWQSLEFLHGLTA